MCSILSCLPGAPWPLFSSAGGRQSCLQAGSQDFAAQGQLAGQGPGVMREWVSNTAGRSGLTSPCPSRELALSPGFFLELSTCGPQVQRGGGTAAEAVRARLGEAGGHVGNGHVLFRRGSPSGDCVQSHESLWGATFPRGARHQLSCRLGIWGVVLKLQQRASHPEAPEPSKVGAHASSDAHEGPGLTPTPSGLTRVLENRDPTVCAGKPAGSWL